MKKRRVLTWERGIPLIRRKNGFNENKEILDFEAVTFQLPISFPNGDAHQGGARNTGLYSRS